MTIYNWPEQERPREKLLHQGSQSLSNAELIAIFLRTGIPGKNAVELARDLLSYFGGVRALLNASLEEFTQFPGMGKVKHIQFKALLELSRRYLEERLKEEPLTLSSHEDTVLFLRSKLQDLSYEVFICLFLNAQNQLIICEEMFKGTLTKTAIYPREIIKKVLAYHAVSVIFAHNHPSGVSYPSEEDKYLTKYLKQSLDFIEVKVHDHLIIGKNTIFSFAKEGIL